MEVLYRRLHNAKNAVWEYWAIYLVSVVMNFLSDRDVVSGSQSFWQKITDMSNPAVFILVIMTALLILYYILLAISGYYTRKQEPIAEFTQIMRSHSDEFAHPKVAGGLIWGLDRTLWVAPNIILGVEPGNVRILEYDSDDYVFEDPELADEFDSFENSKEFRKVKALGNDLPRFMLTRYGSNFHKDMPILTLKLKRTTWGHCQFVWHRFDGQENGKEMQVIWREKIVTEHLRSGLRVVNYPNSMCLHLIIETKDGKVLITKISNEKRNDYPTTTAVSIGEQIELADFIQQTDFEEDFVSAWTRRAVCEEFGLSETQYDTVFDNRSLRVLALDFEMDIYNFALVCTMKMNRSCEEFKQLVNSTIEQKEISDISELHPSEIPSILMKYPVNKKEYHPSSYLRLLLFYLHKNGYRRACKTFCSM